jgi:signal transduction histidine kinase
MFLAASMNRRSATLLRAALWAIVTWTVFSGHHPFPSSRWTVVIVSYAVATAGGVIWTIRHRLRGPIGIPPYAMAIGGAFLLAAAPNSAASAFPFVAAISAGMLAETRRALTVSAVAAATLGIGAAIYGHSGVGALAYSLGFAAATLAAGGRRQSLRQAEQAELLLAQTQRSHEEQLRAAKFEESARIAREIHDVLAHALAGLTIQLEATAALIEQGADPSTVLERVRHAHELARDGLQETRQAVGALRGDRAPAVERIESYVDDYSRAGEGVATLTLAGDPTTLNDSAGDTAVRVVQEALTNVSKHARGAEVSVSVTAGAEQLNVAVENLAGPGGPSDQLQTSGGAYGLAGIRERAALLGGTASAGPTAAGGWKVEVTLPL